MLAVEEADLPACRHEAHSPRRRYWWLHAYIRADKIKETIILSELFAPVVRKGLQE